VLVICKLAKILISCVLYSTSIRCLEKSPVRAHSQLACKECDLLVSVPELDHGKKAVCPRCDFVLTRYHHFARSRLFAFSTSSIIFMCLTLAFPFLTFNSQGREKTVYFIDSLFSLGDGTYIGVVFFLVLTTLLIPMLILLGLNYVLISSNFRRPFPFARIVLKIVFHLQHWNMAEIFLLGILVSMVKITSLAKVDFGWSFLAFILYIVAMATTRVYLDKLQMWRLISPQYSEAKHS
jgi:paraquat-inducible protein A